MPTPSPSPSSPDLSKLQDALCGRVPTAVLASNHNGHALVLCVDLPTGAYVEYDGSEESPDLAFAMLDLLKGLMAKWRPIFENAWKPMTQEMRKGYISLERFMQTTWLEDLTTSLLAEALIAAHEAGLIPSTSVQGAQDV